MLTETKVIIVGAGPAGSACAGVLKQSGIDFVLLDKQTFPRNKTCAGWVTPEVFHALSVSPTGYPYGLKVYHAFHIHLRNRSYKLPVHQYAIRRVEFDRWLLEKNRLQPILHEVREIEKDGDFFIVDSNYKAGYLVGAGGDRCPVARNFFQEERLRDKSRMVIAMEKEFRYIVEDTGCHLWFNQPGLPGYAWYVPKAGGYLNIGLGAYAQTLVKHGENMHQKWSEFMETLIKHGLYGGPPVTGEGYRYRIRRKKPLLQKGNVYITGDAAGLATVDMGEGIGPAIESGMNAALAIIRKQKLHAGKIRARSFSLSSLAGKVLTGKVKSDSFHPGWISRM